MGFPFAIFLGTAALSIKVLVLIKLIVGGYLFTIKFLSLFLNASLSVLNRLD